MLFFMLLLVDMCMDFLMFIFVSLFNYFVEFLEFIGFML